MTVIAPPALARLLNASGAADQDAAWAEFLNAYSRLLLSVAHGFGRDHDAAMDLYTYAIDQLRRDDCHRLRAFDPNGLSQFTTWLVVVARRLCLDHMRVRYGRGGNAEGEANRIARRSLADLVTVELEPSTPSDGAGPDAQAVTAELRESLAHCLAALGPRDRLLLSLRFVDERSARDIAGMMRYSSPFHVYRRLNHLLNELRTALRARGVDGAET